MTVPRVALAADLRVPTKQPHYNFGIIASIEHRLKISRGCKGKTHSLDSKMRISAALSGRKLSLITKTKISVAQRGKKRSAEWRAQVSAKLRGRRHTPEQRAKDIARCIQMGAAKRGIKLTSNHAAKTTAQCLKMSANNKGKPRSSETRAKVSAAQRALHPIGTRKLDLEPYPPRDSTFEYKEWRTAVFKRDNFHCQQCTSTTNEIQAHHIKLWSRFKELRFDVDNGITLCVQCHKLEHKRMRREAKGLPLFASKLNRVKQ